MELCIVGAGPQAQEVAAFLRRDEHRVRAHLVTRSFAGDGAIDVSEAPAVPALVGVGAPGAARRIIEQGEVRAATAWVSSRASLGPGTVVGAGSVVLPMASLGAGCVLGRWCLVNHGAALGHDTRLGTHVSVGPNAAVGGRVRVGDGVVLGLGCTVLPRCVIGDGAVIGAGAVVTRDVAAHAVVAGVPARTVRHLSDWLTSL